MHQLEPNDRWLTTADVKLILQVSDSTLGRLRRSNDLVPVYFGKTPRYRESDVMRYRTHQLRIAAIPPEPVVDTAMLSATSGSTGHYQSPVAEPKSPTARLPGSSVW